jgi:SAM-dependent methyltransferase
MDRRRIAGRRIYQLFSGVFFDPIAFAWRIVEFPQFVVNFVRYTRRQAQALPTFRLRLRYLYPVLGERHASAGVASGHYFHQDIWAARLIHTRQPKRHVDVGSSVAGFIAHLLSFREVEYVDIRPLHSNAAGLHFTKGSLLSLPFDTDSVESLSALHVVEHIGVGRYGDPIDPRGWLMAVEELKRVLQPNGLLYFSVPIGKERLEFDAHRVFDPRTIVRAFEPFRLLSFSYVDDAGDLSKSTSIEEFAGWYSCGLFEFQKPPA